ncbi:MAG TPA: NADP-dependent oxidoreductase [Solirubrobacteraceae bacterium]|jgi:NADPH:quinone reductase-like Zn-dependent oxidoreductase|nr:NADP-dependent oxidoreductase [Solirubrobacteraceae bacterium]
MRAVLLSETGGPEVLRVEEVPTPQPGDGEVLIAVRAASINPIDWKFRRGLSPKDLPAVLGNDISGTVQQSRAEGFAEGDDVFGFAPHGGYAEFAVSPAQAIAKKPADVSHEQAAALPVAGLTAWQALFDRGALQSGQTLLVAGAAGGVGHLAVQFGKHAGARVIGTGSARNREYVLALGADEYVDYNAQDVADVVSDADVVFDTVGGETTATLVPAVREGGVIVVIAGAPPEAEAAERGARAELLIMSPDARQLAEIAALVASGEIAAEIAGTFPLDEVAKAHELSEAGHTRGKLILVP